MWLGRTEVWDFYDGQLTLGLVPADYRAERVRMLLEGSDFAKKLGVIDFVTYVGYMPENPYDPNYQGTLNACKEVAERCKKERTGLLIRNRTGDAGYIETCDAGY